MMSDVSVCDAVRLQELVLLVELEAPVLWLSFWPDPEQTKGGTGVSQEVPGRWLDSLQEVA